MDPQTLIAMRIAQELKPGMLVNLGVGIPTLVANYVPAGMRIYFQSENGLIGTGPIPEEGMSEALLTDAAECEDRVEKRPVTPGPIVPAREQLGELLLAQKQPGPALAAFKESLVQAPGRAGALRGEKAAEAMR